MNVYEMTYSVIYEEGCKPNVETNLVMANSEKEAISIMKEKIERMDCKLGKVYSVDLYN